jgi:positive regulator of sigma E activity
MSTLPSWAQCSIIAALVLLSPALAFLMALAVAMVIGLLKDAGAPVAVAIAAGSTIGYLLVRRLRAAPRGA